MKVLLVEDDEMLAYIIKDGLENTIRGYEVRVAENGEQGLKAWKEFQPDLILCDVQMKGMNGLEMAERIRETDPYTPLLFTSVLTSPMDVVAGIKTGANNYIKKPFSLDELHAYILAFQREWKRKEEANEVEEKGYDLGECWLPVHENVLHHRATGQVIPLGNHQAQILRLLCKHVGETVKREEILQEIWGTDEAEESLRENIYQLRKLLKPYRGIEIKTLIKVGYKLEVDR